MEEDVFETRTERRHKQNIAKQQRFRKNHSVRSFSVDFRDDEGLEEILQRLREDGVTRKEFVRKSFEKYKKYGGFEEW